MRNIVASASGDGGLSHIFLVTTYPRLAGLPPLPQEGAFFCNSVLSPPLGNAVKLSEICDDSFHDKGS